MAKRKSAKMVIRKGSLTENRWLTRQCGWTKDPAKAARFGSQEAAITFARRCGKTGYGLFPTWHMRPVRERCAGKWCEPEMPQGPDRPVPRAAQRWAEKWDLPQD